MNLTAILIVAATAYLILGIAVWILFDAHPHWSLTILFWPAKLISLAIYHAILFASHLCHKALSLRQTIRRHLGLD